MQILYVCRPSRNRKRLQFYGSPVKKKEKKEHGSCKYVKSVPRWAQRFKKMSKQDVYITTLSVTGAFFDLWAWWPMNNTKHWTTGGFIALFGPTRQLPFWAQEEKVRFSAHENITLFSGSQPNSKMWAQVWVGPAHTSWVGQNRSKDSQWIQNTLTAQISRERSLASPYLNPHRPQTEWLESEAWTNTERKCTWELQSRIVFKYLETTPSYPFSTNQSPLPPLNLYRQKEERVLCNQEWKEGFRIERAFWSSPVQNFVQKSEGVKGPEWGSRGTGGTGRWAGSSRGRQRRRRRLSTTIRGLVDR